MTETCASVAHKIHPLGPVVSGHLLVCDCAIEKCNNDAQGVRQHRVCWIEVNDMVWQAFCWRDKVHDSVAGCIDRCDAAWKNVLSLSTIYTGCYINQVYKRRAHKLKKKIIRHSSFKYFYYKIRKSPSKFSSSFTNL